MRHLGTVLTIACLGGLAYGDTVEMKPESGDPDGPGLKLEGKVERKFQNFIIFLVYNETGRIRIPVSKIKNIEEDVDTQLDQLRDKEDFPGRYKVGVWAVEKGKFAEAIRLFEELKDKELPAKDKLNMLKLLGHSYEQRQQLDKALENYSNYLLGSPDDAAIAEKVAKLRKVVTPEPAEGDVKVGPAGTKKVTDGLEGDGVWVAENWGNPGTAQFTVDPNSGSKMVVVQCNGGEKDKAAISRTGQPLNLADSKELLCRIFHNSPNAVDLAFAFVNAQGEFHETKPQRVAPGSWIDVKQKIDGKVFKANRNNFKAFDLELEGKERINRVLFLVYSQKPFTLYLDNVYFK
ncbi:MAG: tetratricopeptide repeat protein [Planctomycetota bacterium]|nr:tetratricopeptide repeat protein [Planctomycetota bacterium]